MPSQFATLLAQLQAGKKSQKSRNKNWNGRLCSFVSLKRSDQKVYNYLMKTLVRLMKPIDLDLIKLSLKTPIKILL